MGGAFNPQILVEKLAKLNSSQQSIETLSHWCIFHMSMAKQVVETWAKQFRCSPRDQRLSFLYLANDILQNSRRKGSEFVGEFWKVLPDALRDVIDNSGESGRNAALRLVKIWEERKVFGSRGPILKEEIVGRHQKTSNKNQKHSGVKSQQSSGNALDKIVSGFQIINSGQLDEDAIISKCKNTVCCVEKSGKEIVGDFKSVNGPRNLEELKGHNATLKDCIEQLSAVEASRTNLVSCLREVLQEQEMKLDQVRNELKVANTQSKKADKICKQFLNSVTESSSNNYRPIKKAKIDDVENSQPPLPPESPSDQPPPPPSSPPPLPPMPPMQAYPFMETAYLYTATQQPPPPPLQGYPVVGPLVNDGGLTAYQSYQMEGVFSSQPMAPMSRP